MFCLEGFHIVFVRVVRVALVIEGHRVPRLFEHGGQIHNSQRGFAKNVMGLVPRIGVLDAVLSEFDGRG